MNDSKSKTNDEPKPDTAIEITGGEIDVREESGYYDAYKGFANNLRIWFIAYGIGAPVFLLSNETGWAAIASSGNGKFLSILFLGGVATQILAALIYKTSMWYLYMGELGHISKESKTYKIAEVFSSGYWIEFIFDLITILLFGLASVLAANVIV